MVGLRNVPGNGSDYQASWRAVRVFGFPVSQSAMEVGAIVGSADGGVGIHRGSRDTSEQTCVMHTGVDDSKGCTIRRNRMVEAGV